MAFARNAATGHRDAVKMRRSDPSLGAGGAAEKGDDSPLRRYPAVDHRATPVLERCPGCRGEAFADHGRGEEVDPRVSRGREAQHQVRRHREGLVGDRKMRPPCDMP